MNTVDKAPSDFESLNARFIPAETIARTFIPSQRFRILSERNHSLLVGPRGSGKTSFLKMLTPPALECWRHDDAESYRARIDYTGVFIPTDTSWLEQLSALGGSYLSKDESEQLAFAALSYHVLYHLVEAFENRVLADKQSEAVGFRRKPVSDPVCRDVCNKLARKAGLQLGVVTLPDLRYAILDLIESIWRFAYRERNLPKEGRGERFNAQPFIGQHFLPLTNQAVEAFNDALGEREGRWALMFDELELAPPFLLQGLLGALRSTNPKLLFKLSLSPYNIHIDEFRRTMAALPGQDYREVRLWFSHKEEGYPFTRELLGALLRSESIRFSDLSDVFGRSPLSEPDDGAYRPGSLHDQVFRESFERDPSFAKFVLRNGVDLRDLSKIRGVRKASLIRKIYPNLLLRHYFRKVEFEGSSPEMRSRKSAEIYAGAESFLAITEGNPRLIIGLCKALLSASPKGGGRISVEAQSAEIITATHRYRALLRLIPAGGPASSGRLSVLAVLDRIGAEIHHEVVKGPFQANPIGTFKIDSSVPDDVLSGLGLALNAGAIIFVPERGDEAMIGSLKEKRFRLNYLLSPFYRTPVRLGEPISLTRLLNDPSPLDRKYKRSVERSNVSQGELRFPNE